MVGYQAIKHRATHVTTGILVTKVVSALMQGVTMLDEDAAIIAGVAELE